MFAWTVAEGDADTDGIAIAADSLALNGGSIQAGTTDATLTHAAVATDAGHTVDGVRPAPVADGAAVQDAAGNDADAFGPEQVENKVTDTPVGPGTAPVVTGITIVSNPRAGGIRDGGHHHPEGELRPGGDLERAWPPPGSHVPRGGERAGGPLSPRRRHEGVLPQLHTVRAEDRDDDGVDVPSDALALFGGDTTLQGPDGTDADLRHPAFSFPGHKVNASSEAPPPTTPDTPRRRRHPRRRRRHPRRR